MKYFIGPVSKNTIDTVIQYSLDYGTEFVFIPSRRQIEHSGGYVNHFTTSEFVSYVKSRNSKLLIERDHGGPGQGKDDDDGFTSLQEDCKYMDILHIDPWKKYPNFDEALEWTIRQIIYCYSLNKDLLYEIGTEEGIRPIDSDELDAFVQRIREQLPPEIFSRIKYLVIQCGTKLLEQTNIGTYDSEKLAKMLAVCNKYGLVAKEHNGDWVSHDILKKKEEQGLTCINIAPEFGEIESSVIIRTFRENPEDLEKFYRICYESGAWRKWVSPDFDPLTNKEKLIKICGHYNFTNPHFIALKNKYNDIDSDICKAIKYRLMELLGVYTVRTDCIICNERLENTVYYNDLETPICYSFFEKSQPSYFIPYNVFICHTCKTVQNKYLCDLDLLYKVNHIDNFGVVKHNMHSFFANFIVQNKHITGTIEIGACHDYLSRLILNSSDITNMSIIDPSFSGNTEKICIIDKYFEDYDISTNSANAIIMSSVFEHFYRPAEILKKIRDSPNIKYIYINHPNLDYALENNVHINLTAEHTFYINNSFIEELFRNYQFELCRMEHFENHTVCYEFRRNKTLLSSIYTPNSIDRYIKYVHDIQQTVQTLNEYMKKYPEYSIYMWPASMHLVPLFIHGFDYSRLIALLDNSPNKIEKIFYGYNLLCKNFKEVIATADKNTLLFLGGAANYRDELDVSLFKGEVIII